MQIIIKFGTGFMNFLFSIMKLFPVQNKIVYISRQQNDTPLDFQLLIDEIRKTHPEYKQVVMTKMIGESLAAKLGYCFHICKQMWNIATAKAAVIDTYCIPICVLKQRESLVVVQIWHALGALKKFSYSILDQDEGRSSKVAKLMHMHENYTYVLTSSETCKPFFQEAFHVREEQMKVIPMPRVDYIVSPEVERDMVERIYTKYPQLKSTEKKIIVYAPTFRKYHVDFEQAVQNLVDEIDFDKYELIVKLHPLSEIEINNPCVIEDHDFITHDIFRIADYVIVDYSAVVFEAALLNKPMFFYTFDYDKYQDKRNFYIDFRKEMPGVISGVAKEIIRAINQERYDLNEIKEFTDRMIQRNEMSCTKRLEELIFDSVKERNG